MNAPQNLSLTAGFTKTVRIQYKYLARAEEQKPDGNQDNGDDLRRSFSVEREAKPLEMKKECLKSGRRSFISSKSLQLYYNIMFT